MGRSGAWASALLALLLTGCAPEPPAPAPSPSLVPIRPSGDGVLRIGLLVPISGDARADALAAVAGVELAVREINEAGGFGGAPVETFARDSADAAAGFAELTGRGVDAALVLSAPDAFASLVEAARTASVPVVTVGEEADGDAEPFAVRLRAATAEPGEAFAARLIASDPAVSSIEPGRDAYEATVRVALAAERAGDDGGASLARALLPAERAGSFDCGGFGECRALIADGQPYRYTGVPALP